MKNNEIRVGLLGAREQGLYVLSELQKQAHVRVAFLYDTVENAVGLEIAEVLGIKRYRNPSELPPAEAFDKLVVTEPRERFEEELKLLSKPGVAVLQGPAEALRALCGEENGVEFEAPEKVPTAEETTEPYTIEDTLQALEKLFDRRELLKFLLDVAVRAAKASAGSIMLYSADADELYIAYATGLSDRVIKNTRQKLGEGVAGSVGQTKRARLLKVTPDKVLYAKDRDRTDITTAISVPLVWKSSLLGVLNVSTRRGERDLDRTNLNALKKLSRRISRVLSESHKLQDVQVRHREWNLRSRMGEIAEKAIHTREKLFLLSNYLAEMLGADTVEMYFSTVEGDWFILGGSNRWATSEGERVRCRRGALSRCFDEQRSIVLAESTNSGEDPLRPLSSAVYCPIAFKDRQGVLVLEYSERYKLDEFLIAKESILLEVGRFIASAMRERRLKRELDAMAKISQSAPALLTCTSIEDLCDLIARVVGSVLESRRVSVRLRSGAKSDEMVVHHYEPHEERSERWRKEDAKCFQKLLEKGQAYSVASIQFEAEAADVDSAFQSLLAYPVEGRGPLRGGILLYDKDPADPLEESVYTEADRGILKQVTSLVQPVLDSLLQLESREGRADAATYESILKGNRERLNTMIETEIHRSDRYHHTFSLIFFRITPLKDLFKKNTQEALGLVNEITQGLQTRTRKTDHSTWINKDTVAMLSLEGTKRIRFLISRILLYLGKDITGVTGATLEPEQILVGFAIYPGPAKTAEELVVEARAKLKPYENQ